MNIQFEFVNLLNAPHIAQSEFQETLFVLLVPYRLPVSFRLRRHGPLVHLSFPLYCVMLLEVCRMSLRQF